MELYTKEYFKKLANQIMLDLNDEEAASLQNDFEVLLQQMDLLNKIDTTDVEEMIYPFETPTAYLREDEVSNVLSQEDALKNAPEVKEGQIIVPKVVG
ncbi:Asp-tRNA(Asn)/Glu-tRNA(Gln) amidotransferase subunit GatC [Breznakia pachnodae]|uniref:Aspartyl/glutamyl-tRNA(Asn/Gln) amidotransferase subunit C n=1 Tax=Breznakia pachnodae TaxID=265178 RepID=A0ABU0E7V3_9FIRM|nr:Asp-tRNA(Asn)/Glu-tRNA(Gln) amidotransferase subunit GatC [Breznakia pachnodae]MDQ0362796.1 aspartyl-tRNA(Asn)/glutamyl-tRNA(Gln) amidotransferase subunit C [Breznakia pachnodae]